MIEQLQGAAFPASALETDVLPARLPGYRPSDLDALCAAGEVVWVGVDPLGERDGRVALYLADALPPAARAAARTAGRRAARGAACASGAARRQLLRRARGGVPGALSRSGAGRPLGPRLVGRGHERHARRPCAPTCARRPRRRAARPPPSARGAVPARGRSAAGACVRAPGGGQGSERHRAKALAEQLLTRHGVLPVPRSWPREAFSAST